jgi:hypothetical protein
MKLLRLKTSPAGLAQKSGTKNAPKGISSVWNF